MENKNKQVLITADEQLCDFCGICVAVCPENCIDLGTHNISISHELCTRCGFCVTACPVAALQKSKHAILSK